MYVKLKPIRVKRFLIVLVASFSQIVAQAQNYNDAINLFTQNKRKEAREAFEKLIVANQNVQEANLALSIMDCEEDKYLDGFKHFKLFADKSENPYPYVYAFYSSGIFTGTNAAKDEGVEDYIKSIANDKKAPATIRAMMNAYLGNREESRGKFVKARNVFSALNDVKNWSSIGPFENLSSSGFNKEFGVLEHPDTTFTFYNKNGAKVNWFLIPQTRNDRWVDHTLNYNIDDAIFYSQTFVKSEEEKEVIMLVGVSGSMKVWLNDVLIGAEEDERNTDLDVYNYVVKLQKGYNRILIQTGCSEIERNNFLVRLSDMDGKLLEDMECVATNQPYTKASQYAIKKIPLFAEQYFESLLANNPNDVINNLLLINVYLHNEKKYEASKVAARLKALAPKSTTVSQAMINTYLITGNRVEANKEKEFIKMNDPESIWGLIYKLDDEEERENWDEAIKLVRRRMALYGEVPVNRSELIKLYNNKKDNNSMYEQIDTAYKLFPYVEYFAELKATVLASKNKDYREAMHIINTYTQDNYSEKMLELQAKAVGSGNKSLIDVYKREVENYPAYPSKYYRIAQAYIEGNQFNDALPWVQKVIALMPYEGSYYYVAGLLYKALNDTANAAAMMRKTIYYSPTNYLAREQLREFEGKKRLSSYFKTNDAAKVYQSAKENPAYAKEDAVVLINDKRMIVYPEKGATEEQNETLVYVNSQSAIQDYKEYYINYNPYGQKLVIETAELLKKDGNKVPAEKSNGNIVFSSLEVGDAIHLNYRIESSYGGKLAEHFWNDVYFNGSSFMESARFTLILPKTRKFNYFTNYDSLKHTEEAIEDYTMHTWEANNVPKINSEPLLFDSVLHKLSVSSIPDWSYVANWYSDVSYIKTKADFAVKEKVRELMKGNEKKTNLEKARIIYDYIEKNYNYSNVSFLHSALVPQRAARTLSTRMGDCKDLSTLFVAMCREAGLKSNLVLVRTNGSGDENFYLPTISFNHCIAQLNDSNKQYYVELTDNHLPFSSMGNGILKANGLPIPADGTHTSSAQLVSLSSDNRPQNLNVRNTKIVIENNNINVHRDVYKIGAEASGYRYYMSGLSEKEKSNKFATSISDEFKRNVDITNLKMEHMDDLSDTVKLSYDVKVSNYLSEIVGMKVLKMPWTDISFSDQLFAQEKREYPIDFQYYLNEPLMKETITLMIPTGKKLVEIPKDITYTSSKISYSLKYTLKPDRLVAVREVRFLSNYIAPSEYKMVKDIIYKINQADSKDYAIK